MELWKTYPNDSLYEISDKGRVRNRETGRVLRPGTMNKYGHCSVAIRKGNSRTVHSLVMETFIGPPPEGHEVAHLNGDGSDNRLQNLAYKTRRENNYDMARLDRLRVPRATVESIRKRAEAGETGYALAKEYGLSMSYTYQIIRGKVRVRG